jgi:hypothetical protein
MTLTKYLELFIKESQLILFTLGLGLSAGNEAIRKDILSENYKRIKELA